jgi:DNA-binding response OmpR family regulator
MTDAKERTGSAPDEPASGDAAAAQATTPVLLLDNDLFFAVKIRDTLAHAGYATRQARTLAAFVSVLAEQRPALAIVNTAARGLDWRAAVAAARAESVPVLAFGAHVDVETQAAARAAGATRVVANSRLAGDLVGTVARVIQLGASTAAPEDDATTEDDG